MKSYSSIGQVILRVVLGIVFLAHGLDKFQSGISNISGFFESIGIPGYMAAIVAVIETAGGIALILGAGTRIVSMVLAFVLLVAIFTAKISMGFLGGYELDVALLAIAVSLVFTGSNLWSIDSLFRANKK
ncbi:DoxX family protein [Paenibacillus sp. N3/727]|uniref:DoxX family protein n=1 Tax=Paenibacillus sp. N3/727 TaxID=2925845 RepID=UPI001F5302EE|nr:DoxX family protein [Paenibacillus sp. N3/727]UNK16517.1 DoxX family protein [Paenibacillus sp. N3/727]